MILTDKQLTDYIRPIIATAVKMDETNDININATVAAILRIIKEDREARE